MDIDLLETSEDCQVLADLERRKLGRRLGLRNKISCKCTLGACGSVICKRSDGSSSALKLASAPDWPRLLANTGNPQHNLFCRVSIGRRAIFKSSHTLLQALASARYSVLPICDPHKAFSTSIRR